MGVSFKAEDDYNKDIPRWIKLYSISFEMSIGNLESPMLDSCIGEECSIELHYFMWLIQNLQIFFVNIILLNFLIALISSSYEMFMNEAV